MPSSSSTAPNVYCVKCRQKTTTTSPQLTTTKNGRAMVKGTCGQCGTRKSMFVKKS